MGKINKINADTWLGLAFVVFGGFLMYLANHLKQQAAFGPSSFPRIISVIMMICGGLLAIKSILGKDHAKPEFQWKSLWKILLLAILIALYTYAMEWIGFLLSTIGIFAAAMLLFGYNQKRIFIIIAVALPTVLFVLFRFALSVPLPTLFL